MFVVPISFAVFYFSTIGITKMYAMVYVMVSNNSKKNGILYED